MLTLDKKNAFAHLFDQKENGKRMLMQSIWEDRRKNATKAYYLAWPTKQLGQLHTPLCCCCRECVRSFVCTFVTKTRSVCWFVCLCDWLDESARFLLLQRMAAGRARKHDFNEMHVSLEGTQTFNVRSRWFIAVYPKLTTYDCRDPNEAIYTDLQDEQ